jgi:hypothetical protein
MQERLLNRPRAFAIGLAMLLTACLILLSGCQSTSPTGAQVTASITITNHSLSDIRVATIEVFREAGYTVPSAFGRELIFEKRASTMTDVAYGGWMDPAVWLRAKVRIEEMKPDVNVLDCAVYRVQNHGDPTLEDEQRAYGMKSKPFKELLASVKTKLDSRPPPQSK